MQRHNSNRRNFNIFGKNTENSDANNITQNNPNESESFVSNSFQTFAKKPVSDYKSGKSYQYMKIKTRPLRGDKTMIAHEKFMQIILSIALVVAIICMCLSVASMFMFFSI